MGEVKIIGSTISLFCTRIEWALKLKGIKYECIPEDVRNKSAMLLQYNPVYKKIPVFLHNGKPICESLVILEYIEDTWKDNAYSLMPEDSYDRAMVRFWAKYVDEKCITGLWRACTTQGEEEEKAIESTLEALAFLEKLIEGGKKYFGGDQIGYLDIVFGWIPLYFSVLGEIGNVKLIIEQEKLPYLHEWCQNFSQNPLIQSCLPPRQDLLDYLSTGISYFRSLAAATKAPSSSS